MEKRFLLAVVLCFFILFIYQTYVEKQQKGWRRQHPPVESPGQTSRPAERQPGVSPSTEPAQNASPPREAPSSAAILPSAEQSAISPCKEVVVDTPLYRAVFCSSSGQLMSWRLKKYQVGEKCSCTIPGLNLILNLIPGGTGEHEEQKGGELIERIQVKNPLEQPLGLDIIGEGFRKPIAVSYRPDHFNLDLTKETKENRISFVGETSIGKTIRKTFTFSPDSYLVHLLIEIEDVHPEFQDLSLGLMLTEKIAGNSKDRYSFSGFMGFIDGSLAKDELKKITKETVKYYAGQVAWAGFSDKYFLTGILPVNNPITSVKLERTQDDLITSFFTYYVRPHLDGSNALFEYNLYVGPKDLDVLKKTGYSLERSIDLGWFSPIAKPLLMVLRFFNRYTHNYGIAIIILTIVIKILFHPLTRKQYRSMKEMQKLQPKLQTMREKYKNDREKMNKEMMDFYRTHKINPLGGCWPMLLQIPVFFALYKALLNSIELRHAPFFLWIKDLSEKDPCYVTPIVMGVSMFIQQKMTPSVGDPNQQKMMQFMPLIFTAMFLQFPSGLVLYWLVNNIISIGQQYYSYKEGT
jgi:YidC/Oxa1 family membrane protein insertase